MGRRVNPYDNAKAESFMKTLKVEGVYLMAHKTFTDIAEHLRRFIDQVKRDTAPLRSRLLSPEQIEDQQTRQMVKAGA